MSSQEGRPVYIKLMSAQFADSDSKNNHATLLHKLKFFRKWLFVLEWVYSIDDCRT